MTRVRVVEETTDGWQWEIFSERMPLREVIRLRVFQQMLDVATVGRAQTEERCRRALDLFVAEGYLVYVDDRRVADLDEMVELRQGTTIHFFPAFPST
jgi:hypothetical protein